MSTITADLYSLPDNRAVSAHLLSLEMTGSLSSPAVGLSASFLCSGPPGEIARAHVNKDGRPLFAGKVDTQRVTFGEKGVSVHVECRSAGGVLLDNEALPHAYFNCDLKTLFSRCVAPYGFRLADSANDKTLALYTVRKGLSQWDAFCGFAERIYGVTPWV
ncbi:MAG: hypothetical protein LBV27_08225, partial [Oscillospiraceae bacterium]|nr:hypothetical protein [Oscillospiraceae bacterium]